MRRLSQGEKAELPQRYLAGETSGQLARALGVSDVAVLNHLRKMGVVRRDPSAARRVYPVWDHAFSTLTPKAAYWIGFLMADGCICDESKIQVGLAAKDLSHLKRLRAFLQTSPRPLYYVPTNNSYQLKVHSRQLVEDLARYGVTPRKSHTAKAENGIHLDPSFWLGLMDGDGTLDLRHHGRVRLVGTEALMSQLNQFLTRWQVKGRNRTFKVAVFKRRDGLHEVVLEGLRARNFLTLVYSAAGSEALDRKKQIAKMLGVHFLDSPIV